MEQVTDIQLYPYLVRLAVVANKLTQYNIKKREEYENATAPSNERRGSEPFTFAKLPKGTLKALMSFFKNLALNKQGITVDSTLKRTYLAFYTQLLEVKSSDSTQFEDLSQKTELLILKFTSCATKISGQAPVNSQGAQFIQLLRGIVKKQGGSAQLDAQLASREEEFNRVVTTPKRPFKPKVIKHTDTDIISEHMAKIMLVSPMLYERDLAKENSLELQDVVNWISRLEIRISMNEHPLYKQMDFINLDLWSRYLHEEKVLISEIKAAFPESAISSNTADILPPNIRAYLCAFLERCIQSDLKEPTLLTAKTKSVIIFVCQFWRVSIQAYVSCIIYAVSQLYHKKLVPVSIIDELYGYCEHILKNVDTPWTIPDTDVAIQAIESLRCDLTLDIIANVKQLMIPSPPKFGPILHAMTINLPDFAGMFNISADDYLVATPQQIEEIKAEIMECAVTNYQELVSLVPRDSTLEVEDIIKLTHSITTNAQKLQKRYKNPLLGCLPIAKLICSQQIVLISRDFTPLWNFCLAQYKQKEDVPVFEDMVKLHGELLDLEDLAAQLKLPPSAFSINSEDILFSYFEKWAADSSNLCLKWVEPAIENDNNEPLDLSSGKMYSSAVKDLFSSFYALIALVNKMEWKNQFHMARLLTTIVGGISMALCKWSSRINDLFMDEMSQAPVNTPSLSRLSISIKDQDQWLSYAKEATAQAAAAVMARNSKPSTDFEFKRESGIKLNNIATAYEMLQQMESQLNSDAVSKSLRDFQTKGGHSPLSSKYLFNVTIIGASGIKNAEKGLYLTLVDHDTRMTLGRTTVSVDGGAPRWNESFEFEVGIRPRLVRATVWSYGSSSDDHVVCGRVMLRLDAKQYVKKEYGMQLLWIDLEGNAGKLHVMFTVDQQFDDIRFHFGKALRFVKQTQDMMITNIVSKFSEFISSTLSRQTLREVTGKGGFSSSVQTGVTQLQKSFNSWFGKPLIPTGSDASSSQPKSVQDLVDESLDPLYSYLNKNFATLAGILTLKLRIEVLSRTWDVVLEVLENLILPPLECTKTSQTQLNSAEMEALYMWISRLKEFFHSDGAGPSLERLQSQNYQQIMTIPVYYDLPVEQLKAESEKEVRSSLRSMAKSTEILARQGTVMAHRNKSVIEHQAVQLQNAQRNSPKIDDIILRTLRLRGEIPFMIQHMKFRERLMQRELTERALQGSFF